MIKLIAAYRPLDVEGRKLEITSGPKLRRELESEFRTKSTYQDVRGSIYSFDQLLNQELDFTDKVKYKLVY
jgi:hypothetical protein